MGGAFCKSSSHALPSFSQILLIEILVLRNLRIFSSSQKISCGSRSWWTQRDIRGFMGFRICKKNSRLKSKIKVWNKDVFGRIDASEDALSREVEWDGKGERQLLSQEEVAAR